MSQPLVVGDRTFLGAITGVTINCFGQVSDLDTPDQVAFTIEGFGSNAILSTAALIGPPGPPGTNAPAPKLQSQIFDSVDDLPTNLTDDPVDIGKCWIIREWDTLTPPNQIGSWFYIWMGDHYEQFKMGSPGQAGPVPNVTWSYQLVDSTVTSNSLVTQSGTPFDPSVLVQVNKELIRGPVGPSTNISAAPDVDHTTAPETGDVLTYNSAVGKWQPEPVGTIVPKFYTMPQAAFVNVPLALDNRVPLGSFTIPPLEWDCVPYVSGHLRITGVEADVTPFLLGCEVRLGEGGASGGGTLVARGWGNTSTFTDVKPHASGTHSGTAADAISPDNGRAVIPAGSTGAAATLYVNAFNDGAPGIYHFDRTGAQLAILCIPV